MGHAPARIQDFVRAASANPDLASKVAAAIDAGDNRAVLKLMAEQQWTKAPARAAPEAAAEAAPPASRSPMSFEDRIANDPNIRRGIEASGVDVASGDIEGMLDAYRQGIKPRRASRPPAGVVDAPSAPPPTGMIPYGVRGPGVPVGGPGGAGVAVPPPTALSTRVTPRPALPAPPPSSRALSTNVDLPRIGTTAGVPVPSRPRLPAPEPIDWAAGTADEAAALGPNPGDNVNQFGAEEGAWFDYPEPDARVVDNPGDNVNQFGEEWGSWTGEPGPRVIDAEFSPEDFRFRDPPPPNRTDSLIARLDPRRDPRAAAAAGIALGAAGASMMGMPEAQAPAPAMPAEAQPARPARPMVPNVIRPPRPMSTADLAAATRPPPSVRTQEEAPAVVDYAQMARDKIRQANEIQLRERRITPESAALAREADALYQRAAEARRTGNHPPIMPVEQQNEQTSAIRAQARRELASNTGSDARSEARRIMSQLNAGQIPPGQQAAAKAEMNRLFAVADQQDNARRNAR